LEQLLKQLHVALGKALRLRRFPLRVRPGELKPAFFALEALFSQMMPVLYDCSPPHFLQFTDYRPSPLHDGIIS
jgi:hypothetical protein